MAAAARIRSCRELRGADARCLRPVRHRGPFAPERNDHTLGRRRHEFLRLQPDDRAWELASGLQLRVNAQSLTAGEDLVFDGAAETGGGRFLVYGGFGVDQLTGGSGNDIFFFEAGRFGAADRIVGGAGNDAVVISGAPSGVLLVSITVASGTLSGVESLSFNGRFASDPSSRPSYDVVIENGNIAPGGRLIVNGSSLEGTQQMNVDASRVADGRVWLFGGGFGETLTGGSGDDLLYGQAAPTGCGAAPAPTSSSIAAPRTASTGPRTGSTTSSTASTGSTFR